MRSRCARHPLGAARCRPRLAARAEAPPGRRCHTPSLPWRRGMSSLPRGSAPPARPACRRPRARPRCGTTPATPPGRSPSWARPSGSGAHRLPRRGVGAGRHPQPQPRPAGRHGVVRPGRAGRRGRPGAPAGRQPGRWCCSTPPGGGSTPGSPTPAAAVRMTDGTEVRMRARVTWYDRGGRLQLQMSDIDPAFTLGRLAADRDRLLRTLDGEGLLTRQAGLPRPVLPLRLGLVTSAGSAAEHDVLDELRRSGIGFSVVTADVRVQGATPPARSPGACGPGRRPGVDAVCWCGAAAPPPTWPPSTARPSPAVATLDVPVLTGIGHEIDRSVADEVAHAAYKTPTACAQAVVADVRAVEAAPTTRGGASSPPPPGRAGRGRAPAHLRAPRRPRHPPGPGGGRPRPRRRGAGGRAATGRSPGRPPRSTAPPGGSRAAAGPTLRTHEHGDGGRRGPAGAAAARLLAAAERELGPSTPRCGRSTPAGARPRLVDHPYGRRPHPAVRRRCRPRRRAGHHAGRRLGAQYRLGRPGPRRPRAREHTMTATPSPPPPPPAPVRAIPRVATTSATPRPRPSSTPSCTSSTATRSTSTCSAPGPAGRRAAPVVPVAHRRRPLRGRAGGGRARGRGRSSGGPLEDDDDRRGRRPRRRSRGRRRRRPRRRRARRPRRRRLTTADGGQAVVEVGLGAAGHQAPVDELVGWGRLRVQLAVERLHRPSTITRSPSTRRSVISPAGPCSASAPNAPRSRPRHRDRPVTPRPGGAALAQVDDGLHDDGPRAGEENDVALGRTRSAEPRRCGRRR